MANDISNIGTRADTSVVPPHSGIKKVLMVIGLVIIGVIIGVFFMNGFSSSRQKSPSYGPSSGLGFSSSGPSEYDSESLLDSTMPRSTALPSLSTQSNSTRKLASTTISQTTTADRRIKKGGEFSLVVDNVSTSAESIKSIANSLGGEMIESNQSDPSSPRLTMTIKVPVAKFDSATAQIRQQASRVSSEYIRLEDVTEQYTDLQARLKNLQASEARYQEIMKSAKTIQEVLEVQRYLTEVRGQIEQLQVQILNMERQTDMATITVNLATDEEELPIVTPREKWKPITVFKNDLRSLLNFFKSLSYVMIWLIVFSVIWVPLLLVIRYTIHRRKLTNIKTTPKSP